jgi:hypothetical protein
MRPGEAAGLIVVAIFAGLLLMVFALGWWLGAVL